MCVQFFQIYVDTSVAYYIHCYDWYCFFVCSFVLFIVIIMSLVTGLFSLVRLLLNQLCSPPFRLQVSDCSTFCIMHEVTSVAVCCSESVECFPGMTSIGSNYYPYIHTFHVTHCCISVYTLFYFSFFLASFCIMFLFTDIAMSISLHIFSFLFLSIISVLFAITSLPVCTS